MQLNMTRGNPLSIILKFALPLFVGNVFQQIYNTVDSMIVGRFVGENALAAVGSTGTIMFMIIGLSNGMSTGFTVLTSQKFGEGNDTDTRGSVGNGMFLSALVVAVMTALSLTFMPNILRVMNTPEEIFDDAYSYVSIICAGIVTTVAYNFFSSCLRAIGNSRVPLYTLIASACLNVILDLFFIRVLHMGVAGAAWATVIAQGVSALLCMIYIGAKEPLLRPALRQLKPNRDFTKHQLSVGIPMALQFGITGSGTVIMQAAVNLFGPTAVAAYSASGKISSMLVQGPTTIGQAMATYAGQNYGARKPDRIRKGVGYAVKINVVYAIVAGIVAYFGLPLFLRLFFNDQADMEAILSYGKQYILVCASFYVPLSVIFTFRNTMQGCGYGFLPMMGGVVELFARLSCALLAMRTLSFTLACFCDPAAWFSAGVFTMFAYFYVMKKVEAELSD